MDMQFQEILEKAENGQPLSRKDCGYLLRLDEKSFEAALLRATAASIIRKKNDNLAIFWGQICLRNFTQSIGIFFIILIGRAI